MFATRSGFFGPSEVVEVLYDPRVVSYERLLETVKTEGCAQTAWPRNDGQERLARAVFGEHVTPAPGAMRPDAEPKYYLLQTPLKHVPMSELQAVKVNAHVQKGGFERFLSPRQKELLTSVREHPDAGWPVAAGVEIGAAWRAAGELRRKRSGR